MEKITKQRNKINQKIKKFQNKLHDLEYQLIQLDRQMNDLNQKEIIHQMKLNKQQNKVIKADVENNHLLVLACPGSGKTHTLISRYINLVTNLEKDPEKIILITFTKKAGQEMEERLRNIIPNKVPNYVGSLHGLGYRLLQRYHKVSYTVLDDKDSKTLLKQVVDDTLETQQLDDNEVTLLKSKIIMVVEQASTNHPFNIISILNHHNLTFYQSYFKLIIKNYQELKKKQNLVDFNDLMVLLSKFMHTKKALEFANEIEYIFFDEYQDVNPIQNHILSQLIKLNPKINLMVVGDDAQAIYKFRGSDIKFIKNYHENFSPTKTFYLETNYRSTNEIVDFCQNIISNNKEQFEKKVRGCGEKTGSKPNIVGFRDQTEQQQYKWICNDIMQLHEQGVAYSNIVILARKNSLLEKIEYHLLLNKIPTQKHLGLSLLDKVHIKDFLAFLTILINNKSSLHWKRILALHPNIGMIKANQIIDFGSDILTSINTLISKANIYKNSLQGLVSLFETINKCKSIYDQIKYIINYLEPLWKQNKYSHIEDKIDDVRILMSYIKQHNSIAEFINNLYLNHEVDTKFEESVYLTTVHGAKGLEWDYVYIIDMDSSNFPAIMPKFYLDEINEIEEERRLFYVASSRCKSQLNISFNQNHHPEHTVLISPFIKELDNNLFNSYNIDYIKPKLTGNISKDVYNHLKFNGFNLVREELRGLEFSHKGINKNIDVSNKMLKIKYRTILGNFLDYVISKMIATNFPEQIKKFDLNMIHRNPNFNKTIYSNYCDKLIDWRNCLEDIFYISSYKYNDNNYVDMWKEYLLGLDFYQFLLDLEENLISYISDLKPKEIYTHYNISDENIKGELDILIDDKLIEIKSSPSQIATTSNLSQTLIYGYLLNKKNININQINLYNPVQGIMTIFNTKNFNFKKFAKKIYGKTKS